MHPRSLLGALALCSACALAQPAPGAKPLTPLDRAGIAAVLERPPGAQLPALATQGDLALFGKTFYIAEYRVLVEAAGEWPMAVADGSLFGLPVFGERVRVQYSARPDVAAIQAIVDRSWDDLRHRLVQAGVRVAADEEVVAEHGAVFDADQPGSTDAAPVWAEARSGEHLRRYLVFAPTGSGLTARLPGGLNPGNLAVRLAWPLKKIEALSLALAVNFTGSDAGAPRASGYSLPPDAPPRLKPLSPLMEIRSAPGSSLVQAHALPGQVNLNEVVVLDAEFARLRPAPADAAAGADPLGKLIALGGRLVGARPDAAAMPALLELDGPQTARSMLLGLAAVNEAIVKALQRATAPLGAGRP